MRGLFLIDPNGVLQYQVVHSLSVGRDTDEVLRVLEGLQTGGACPSGRRRGEAVLDPSRELGPNRVVGAYRIEGEWGGGSFGTEFRAGALGLDGDGALKVLRPGSPVTATGLRGEARAAAALNHASICIIHAVGSSEGVSMIVMEYSVGEPLSKRMGQAALPLEQVAAL